MKNPKFKERGVQPINGIILHGLPRTGKTFIAESLIEELGKSCKKIKISDNGSEYQHLTAKKIFNDAKFNSPSILFIDEFEAFVPPRGTGITTVYDNKITSEFLRQLNECSNENVYVIAATNHPELIDDAIKRTGRFDRKTFVPPLDNEARVELFNIKFKNYKRIEKDIDFEKLGVLTHNYTAAQINKIIRDTKRSVYEDIVKNGNKNSIVTQAKLIKRIKETEPELTDKIIEKYKNL